MAGAWVPRVDGLFLTDAPMKMVNDGVMAKVPTVIGSLLFLLHSQLGSQQF